MQKHKGPILHFTDRTCERNNLFIIWPQLLSVWLWLAWLPHFHWLRSAQNTLFVTFPGYCLWKAVPFHAQIESLHVYEKRFNINLAKLNDCELYKKKNNSELKDAVIRKYGKKL